MNQDQIRDQQIQRRREAGDMSAFSILTSAEEAQVEGPQKVYSSNPSVNAAAALVRKEIEPARFAFRRGEVGCHRGVLMADYYVEGDVEGYGKRHYVVSFLASEDRDAAADELALQLASAAVAGETARSEWP